MATGTDPRIPEGMLDRLEGFVKPFAAIMENGLGRTEVQPFRVYEYAVVIPDSSSTADRNFSS
jgi:hypothetical protein